MGEHRFVHRRGGESHFSDPSLANLWLDSGPIIMRTREAITHLPGSYVWLTLNRSGNKIGSENLKVMAKGNPDIRGYRGDQYEQACQTLQLSPFLEELRI
jgi:hypothetical protein